MSDPLLLEVTRGRYVESRHAAAIAVYDAKGRARVAIGDVERPIFPRSAIKSIQQLPLVESGAADRYSFGNAELALACSSHSGEPRHVATARKMLAAAGRGEADLACGGHPPANHAAADALVRAGEHWSRIHDNCSGKHSGFICLACGMDLDPRGYETPAHPAQREIADALADVTGAALGEPAVDGCSVPAYAIPLRNLAQAFAKTTTGEGLTHARAAAARRLIDAVTAEPFMVAGTGRFDTEVLIAFGKRVFVKGGAEGVICAALPELGLGIAIKADDGAGRATEPLLSTVIAALLPMSDRESAALRPKVAINDRNGARVGEIRTAAELGDMLAAGSGVAS
ncbi:MAG TPA: asparaginase [Bauldia sp.]|nr:asparaginase [Bauldia sp.]